MAQLTGTQMLAAARVFAQDNDASGNYYVSDADALVLLNDILSAVASTEENRPLLVAASASGLTFTAGTVRMVTTAAVNLAEVGKAFQAATDAVNVPTAKALRRVSVEEMRDIRGADDDGTFDTTPSGTDWSCYSAERQSGLTGEWVVEVWPPLSVTKYLTIEATREIVLSALTGTPDLSTQNGRRIIRVLAADMALLAKRPQAFVDRILSRIPQGWMQKVLDAAHYARQGQARVSERASDA